MSTLSHFLHVQLLAHLYIFIESIIGERPENTKRVLFIDIVEGSWFWMNWEHVNGSFFGCLQDCEAVLVFRMHFKSIDCVIHCTTRWQGGSNDVGMLGRTLTTVDTAWIVLRSLIQADHRFPSWAYNILDNTTKLSSHLLGGCCSGREMHGTAFWKSKN